MPAVPKAVLVLPLLGAEVLLKGLLFRKHPEEETQVRELQGPVHA
jgi:hypothetical protein